MIMVMLMIAKKENSAALYTKIVCGIIYPTTINYYYTAGGL